MTEGEVCLDRAKMIETQRQPRLDRTSAVKNPLFKRKRDSWFQDEGRLAIIGAEFWSHLGNVGGEHLLDNGNHLIGGHGRAGRQIGSVLAGRLLCRKF